MLKDVLMLWD